MDKIFLLAGNQGLLYAKLIIFEAPTQKKACHSKAYELIGFWNQRAADEIEGVIKAIMFGLEADGHVPEGIHDTVEPMVKMQEHREESIHV